jgi:hypothetical protein
VAILLALLVYVTWRSNTTFWSSGSVHLPLCRKRYRLRQSEPQAPTTAKPEEDVRSAKLRRVPQRTLEQCRVDQHGGCAAITESKPA